MFASLVDDPTWLYMLLVIAALALGFAWWQTRLTKYLVGAGVAILLIGVIWFLTSLIDTDQKRIERSVREMAAGVRANNMERIFAQISERFSFNGLNKAQFRQRVDDVRRQRNVEDVAIWDFQPIELSQDQQTARVQFSVKPHGNWGGGEAFYRCRATFILDPDKQWRLQTFQILNPFVEDVVPIPGF